MFTKYYRLLTETKDASVRLDPIGFSYAPKEGEFEKHIQELEAHLLKINNAIKSIDVSIEELTAINNAESSIKALFAKKARETKRTAQKLCADFRSYKSQLTKFAQDGNRTLTTLKAENKSKQAQTTPVKYAAYIRSEQWRTRASTAKRQANYRCQVCNKHQNEVQLDAHHRTYERLGNERPDDITVLCRDCHELYESQKRLKSKKISCKHCTTLFVPAKSFHKYCDSCSSKLKPCRSCGKKFIPPRSHYHTCSDCFRPKY